MRGILHKGQAGGFGVTDEFFNLFGVVKIFHPTVFFAVVKYLDVIGCGQEKKPPTLVWRGVEEGTFLQNAGVSATLWRGGFRRKMLQWGEEAKRCEDTYNCQGENFFHNSNRIKESIKVEGSVFLGVWRRI